MQQLAVGLLDRIRLHLGFARLGEQDVVLPGGLQAATHVGTAALDDQRPEQGVMPQHQIGFEQIGLHVLPVVGDAVQGAFEVLFHLAEMAWQRVNAERRVLEIIRLAAREQLDHVLQIAQAVVHRGGGEHEQRLTGSDLIELPVAGLRVVLVALGAGVPEVVRLVDDDDIGALAHAVDVLRDHAAAHQVGVVEDFELTVFAEQMRQAQAQRAFPHRLAG